MTTNDPLAQDLAGLGLTARRIRPLAGGDTCRSWRATLTDGREVFVKRAPADAIGMVPLEAAGLRWLAHGGIAVPDVVAVGAELLALTWHESVPATPAAAAALGRALGRLHSTRADAFGCPPEGSAATTGWVGRVPVPFGEHATWPQHYVTDRLVPTADAAQATGGLTAPDRAVIDRLCDALDDAPAIAGPPQLAAPIHGDLWAGNVVWQRDTPLLVDPAAVGGHPETDLAMLHLFGLPHLDEVLATYTRVRPLDRGWHSRIPLHQVFPLLVHAVMFGPGYGRQAAAAAAAALRRGTVGGP